MIFILNNSFTASVLRGEHLAQALGTRCYFQDLCGTRNDTVVIVKDADRGLVEDAKERSNRIVYDIIDRLCYKLDTVPFADLVDVLIVPNHVCIEHYRTLFPKARYAVIPHQWDPRIVGSAPQDYCRTAYIGKVFNLAVQGWIGERVFESAKMLAAAPQYNLHLALAKRDGKKEAMKPATKVSTAAAVGANAVTYDDPSAIELLGEDYPYLVRGDPLESIKFAQRDFGSRRWKDARERMRLVKERTSLPAIAALYKRLADGDDTILIDAPRTANRMAA